MANYTTFGLSVLAGSISLLTIAGCSLLLQESPVEEIHPSCLTCEANPEIVDGDIETEGVLQSEPGVERGAAGVLIKLDEPRYIKYIEIYAASRVSDVRIYIASEEPEGEANITFQPVRLRAKKDVIDKGKSRKFEIGKDVLYLKLLTGWVVDYTSGKKIKKSPTLGYNREIPMIGPVVKEVKFYTLASSP